MRYSLVFSQWRVWCIRRSASRSSSVTPIPVTSITFRLHLSNALKGCSGSDGEGVVVDSLITLQRLFSNFGSLLFPRSSFIIPSIRFERQFAEIFRQNDLRTFSWPFNSDCSFPVWLISPIWVWATLGHLGTWPANQDMFTLPQWKTTKSNKNQIVM